MILISYLIFPIAHFQQYFSYRISWRPVLVVEATGVPGENHATTMDKQLANFIQKLHF
jgi:hypothetical protein